MKNGKLLYHLTDIQNFDSIIENGLVSRRILLDNHVMFGDIADVGIITRRTELGLDNYIPFHFHPYSSFDCAVKNTHPQNMFIYLCIKRDLARENDFLILPKHPLSIEECTLYPYDEGFDLIDWDTMSKTGIDEYSKQVKMAECLTDKRVPINCINQIVVKDETVKTLVEEKLRNQNAAFPPPYINIQNWF